MGETDKDNELVLCVPAGEILMLFARCGVTDFLPAERFDFVGWLEGATKAFLPRKLAEGDVSWRHFASYAVIRSGAEVFTYRRGASGSEGRLHGLRSVGFGGHTTLAEDYATNDWDHRPCWPKIVANSAGREIDEELEWGHAERSRHPLRFAGLIASDDDAVSRVHVGTCYVWDVPSFDFVSPREGCLEDATWVSPEELRRDVDRYESWSRILLSRLPSGPERGPGEAKAS